MMDKDIKTNEELTEILSKMKTMNYFNQFIEQYLQGSKHDQLMKVRFKTYWIAVFSSQNGEIQWRRYHIQRGRSIQQQGIHNLQRSLSSHQEEEHGVTVRIGWFPLTFTINTFAKSSTEFLKIIIVSIRWQTFCQESWSIF